MRTSPSGNRPIGVFDSGLGGLTVLKEIGRLMPAEDLIYFGDMARVPYGSKSRETVTRYCVEIARFLVSLKVKALVVACNTGSALALQAVARKVRVPVIGVIEPGVEAALKASPHARIGVIGTEATIASKAYAKALRARRPGARVRSKACPLFVPLVEEGWWRHPAARLVAKRYLADFKGSRIDTLILGCTHYPLLKAVVAEAVGPKMRLIDSAEQTALATRGVLEAADLLRRGRRFGKKRFFVSDAPRRFHRLARRLLGVRIDHVGLHVFD